jgi:hypothetical protein
VSNWREDCTVPGMPLTPTQVVFDGLDYSDALAATIRGHVAWLEHYCQRLVSCRVTVELPHRHRAHGREVCVRIEATIPGLAPIVVGEDDQSMPIALTEAFAAARRRLQDAVRVQRHAVKVHQSKFV